MVLRTCIGILYRIARGIKHPSRLPAVVKARVVVDDYIPIKLLINQLQLGLLLTAYETSLYIRQIMVSWHSLHRGCCKHQAHLHQHMTADQMMHPWRLLYFSYFIVSCYILLHFRCPDYLLCVYRFDWWCTTVQYVAPQLNSVNWVKYSCSWDNMSSVANMGNVATLHRVTGSQDCSRTGGDSWKQCVFFEYWEITEVHFENKYCFQTNGTVIVDSPSIVPRLQNSLQTLQKILFWSSWPGGWK